MSNQTDMTVVGKTNLTPGATARAGRAKSADTTKSSTLKALMLRRNGATISQLQKKLNWQPHTIRAAISRLRKAGVTIDLDRSGKSPRYRIVSSEADQ